MQRVAADETSTVRSYSLGDKWAGQMIRLKKIAMAGLAAVAIGGVGSSASAVETGAFQDRLNGATIGLPLGALPPPGLYTSLETAYINLQPSGGRATGNQGTTQLPAIAQAVPLLWVPGWNFLGATYAAGVVQSFYIWTSCAPAPATCTGGSPIVGGGFVYTNTLWNPITLSWNLGNGWFVSGAFNFFAPDGTRQVGTPNPDYWTFEPAVAFSYFGNNWTASANFFYDFSTRSDGVCCSATTITSGEALYGDFAAVYKIGKWSIGPVGYFEVQTTADTGPGCPALCGYYRTAAAGGLIGYDFGPLDLQVWVTDSFVGQNAQQGAGGIIVWSRMGFKLWGPEAPKPLVAKN
jgi:hypothetical protein